MNDEKLLDLLRGAFAAMLCRPDKALKLDTIRKAMDVAFKALSDRDENGNTTPPPSDWVGTLEQLLNAIIPDGTFDNWRTIFEHTFRPEPEAEAETEAEQARSGIALFADMIANSVVELWHDGESPADRKAYATTLHHMNPHAWYHVSVRSSEFETICRQIIWQRIAQAVTSSGMMELILMLDARAKFDGRGHKVWQRVAGDPTDSVYVDMTNDAGQVAVITAGGWTLETMGAEHPRLVRPPLARPMAIPVKTDRKLKDLLALIATPDAHSADRSMRFLGAGIVTAFLPNGPFFVLNPNGPQGSLKSTVSKRIVALTDPNQIELEGTPKSPRDLGIVAARRRVVALDIPARWPLGRARNTAGCHNMST